MGFLNFFKKIRKEPKTPEEAMDKVYKVTKKLRLSEEEIKKLRKKKNPIDIEKNVKNPKEFSLRNDAIYNAIKGNFEKVIKICDKAIKINPEGAYNFFLRGRSKGDLGYFNEGIKDLDKAIELDEKYADAYTQRAIIKMKKHPEFINLMGSYEKKLSKKQQNILKDIIKDFDKAPKLDSKDAEALDYRGMAKMFLKDYKGGEMDFKKALPLIKKTPYHSLEEIEAKVFNIKEELYLARTCQLKKGKCSICKKEIKNFIPTKNAFTPLIGEGPEIDVNKKPILVCDKCKHKLK